MQRCKAKSKRSGEQCKNYAIKDYGVCRMHGAHEDINQARASCLQKSIQQTRTVQL